MHLEPGHLEPGHLEVKVSGPAAIESDLFGAFAGEDVLLLVAAGGLVAVLLAATWRSPVLWLLPLLCVGAAEAVAEAVVYGLGHLGLPLTGESTSLVTRGGLWRWHGLHHAAARYREELHRHDDHRAAMAVAFQHAAPAVGACALTVAAATLPGSPFAGL